MLKPLDDKVLVKPSEPEEKTTGGILLPDTAQKKPRQGEVIAVGPGRLLEKTGERAPLEVKVGDIVVYSEYGGTQVTINNEDYIILTESQLLAVKDNVVSAKGKKDS